MKNFLSYLKHKRLILNVLNITILKLFLNWAVSKLEMDKLKWEFKILKRLIVYKETIRK
jgi:hypothetical protein